MKLKIYQITAQNAHLTTAMSVVIEQDDRLGKSN